MSVPNLLANFFFYLQLKRQHQPTWKKSQDTTKFIRLHPLGTTSVSNCVPFDLLEIKSDFTYIQQHQSLAPERLRGPTRDHPLGTQDCLYEPFRNVFSKVLTHLTQKNVQPHCKAQSQGILIKSSGFILWGTSNVCAKFCAKRYFSRDQATD